MTGCQNSATQGQGQSYDLGPGASLSSPSTSLGNPNNLSSSVYRDDADGLNRSNESRQRPLIPSKPQSLTEFQILVAGSIGRIVPVYGAERFANVPDTFAPVKRIPVTPEYVVGPGDGLLIRLWGQVNQNLQLTVDRSGSIYIPQAGAVRVAGLQFGQLQSFLKSRLDRIYRNYDLNVNLGQLRSIQIFVTGQARRPGSYTISSLSTLVNAIFACGGPASQGTLRNIQLKRDGAAVTNFDLYDLLVRGDKSKDVPLVSGDVIYFPPVGPQVAVVGSVQRPAIYELHAAETVADALKLAGGVSAVANISSLEIERSEIQPNGEKTRVALDVAMNARSLATLAENADLMRVRAGAPRFDKTVTLRGNVASPGRFAWHSGMHIRDLIPNQESLLTADYWLRRQQLGLPVADFQPMLPPIAQTATSQPGQAINRSATPQDVQAINSGLFPQLSVGVPNDTEAPSGSTAQFQSLAASTDEKSSSTPAATTQPSAYSTTPETLGVGSRLITSPHFPIQTQVVRTSPDIDWCYAVVERIDLKTLKPRLVPFNLGAIALEHDESADLDLQPGDVITIFSDADIRVPRAQQTRYVRLEGEFAHSGVYSVLPEETLHQLVIRAGGLTDQAYLYGSQFSRESTRREQQQRLDEYVSSLSYQIDIAAANKSATVVSPQEAATTGASQRELVNRLHQIRATGRIVLHIETLPYLPLEDGDRFIVPPVPSKVGIVGAVYDSNSFLYLPHQHAGDYLRNAGGPNRHADRRQIFIIRADGSVVSRQYLQPTVWTDDKFSRQPIYPGDTLVVPESVNKTTVLRGLTDWSAVFSQFALGAAAINVLR
jgi:polysaccharide export outer membrane protein